MSSGDWSETSEMICLNFNTFLRIQLQHLKSSMLCRRVTIPEKVTTPLPNISAKLKVNLRTRGSQFSLWCLQEPPHPSALPSVSCPPERMCCYARKRFMSVKAPPLRQRLPAEWLISRSMDESCPHPPVLGDCERRREYFW